MDTSKCASCMNAASMVGRLNRIEIYTEKNKTTQIFVCDWCKEHAMVDKRVSITEPQ